MGRLCIFVSVFWLVIGGISTIDRLLFLSGTLSTHGTVISCQFNVNDNVCYPTIRFFAQSGQKLNFIASSASTSYHKEDVLPVIYHPATPQDARIDDALTIWLPPLAGCGGFLLSLFTGFYVLRRGRDLQAR
jgi:hypothetical protein